MNTTPAPPNMTAIDGGVHMGVVWATTKAPLYGAVNGYVQIPEGHPWHGLDYDDEALLGVEVSGGLTYSDHGWVGFDTLHLGDYWPDAPGHWVEGDAKHWTPELVAEETRGLAEQVAQAGGAS